MSFFGLTSFGPEKYIQSNLVNSNGFTLFSDQEFKLGFEKITQLRNTPEKIYLCDFKNFLSYSFGFTPLDDEVELFKQYSKISDEKEFLTLEEMMSAVNEIRYDLNKTAEKSIKYNSFKQYYDDTYKHRRKEVCPTEIYKTPVTFGQTYGFQKFTERDLNDVKHPIIKCDETKYAEIIAMTGKHILK